MQAAPQGWTEDIVSPGSTGMAWYSVWPLNPLEPNIYLVMLVIGLFQNWGGHFLHLSQNSLHCVSHSYLRMVQTQALHLVKRN